MKLAKNLFLTSIALIIFASCLSAGDFTPLAGIVLCYIAYVNVFKKMGSTEKYYDPVDYVDQS